MSTRESEAKDLDRARECLRQMDHKAGDGPYILGAQAPYELARWLREERAASMQRLRDVAARVTEWWQAEKGVGVPGALGDDLRAALDELEHLTKTEAV